MTEITIRRLQNNELVDETAVSDIESGNKDLIRLGKWIVMELIDNIFIKYTKFTI